VSATLVVADIPPPPRGVPTSDVLDVATFRAHRPEFADATLYPDVVVQLYIDNGSIMALQYLWGGMRQMGVELFTCHMLALQQYAMKGSTGGVGIPGFGVGVPSSKSVSKVSVSYDTTLSSIEGGGPWNLTMYGQMWLWYVQLIGTGGFEVLGLAYSGAMVGEVNTWQRGVQMSFGS
jgi:hypothetical protein